MNVLIIKLNATGDVVRTTTLLRRLPGSVTWLTAPGNLCLVHGLAENLRSLAWENRDIAASSTYDLVINLEDDVACASFVTELRYKQLFGAYLNKANQLEYTASASPWFDLSLISRYGRARADELKFLNRRSYQDLIFEGLGFRFEGEAYLLPQSPGTDICGDVAIAPVAGPVWPMKNWAFYGELKHELEQRGLRVNMLPKRASLLEDLGDVKGHRCLVSGDSLPMHLALGAGIACVTIFNCTSPWEIYDYGLQTKVVSPLLGDYFYKRESHTRATTAVAPGEVLQAVIERLGTDAPFRATVSI